MMTTLRRAASRAASGAVHRAWHWAQRAGTVSAERPGPHRFSAIGEGTRLAFPQGTIFGAPWIELGAHCVVAQHVTLTAGLMPGHDLGPDAVLRVGGGTVLGRGSHVVAQAPVTIGADVYVGPYCYITSTNHSYDDPTQPVGHQWPRTEPVEIGAGSWLGTGVIVLPGARLGRNVVVAAGAVVRGDVPDHTVVAGTPARAVRALDPLHGWQPPLRTPPPGPAPPPPRAASDTAVTTRDVGRGDPTAAAG